MGPESLARQAVAAGARPIAVLFHRPPPAKAGRTAPGLRGKAVGADQQLQLPVGQILQQFLARASGCEPVQQSSGACLMCSLCAVHLASGSLRAVLRSAQQPRWEPSGNPGNPLDGG